MALASINLIPICFEPSSLNLYHCALSQHQGKDASMGLLMKMDKIIAMAGSFRNSHGPFTMHLLPTEHFTHA